MENAIEGRNINDRKRIKSDLFLNRELERLEEELKAIENKSLVKSPLLSGMPYGSGFSNKTADYAIRVNEIKRLINITVDRILKTRAEMEQFLQEIEDPELRMILRLRSVQHLGWQEIGDELGMDRRTSLPENIRNFVKRNLPTMPMRKMILWYHTKREHKFEKGE